MPSLDVTRLLSNSRIAGQAFTVRRARGRTGEKPLIDMGAMRRSIAYVIKNE